MKPLLFALLLLLAPNVMAEQQGGQFKDLTLGSALHCFSLTFIQPNIAKAYDLTRSGSQAIVNISVLADKPSKPAVKANVSGFARDLLGKKVELEFKEVVEGEAIYYLAQLDYDHEDVFRFEINISQGSKAVS